MTLFAAETTNALVGWLTIVTILGGICGAIYLLFRGGGATAIDTLTKANRVLEKRGDELEKRIHDLERKLIAKDTEIAELRGKTDISVALIPLLRATAAHEERAQERHDAMLRHSEQTTTAMLNLLELIAANCGPEPE